MEGHVGKGSTERQGQMRLAPTTRFRVYFISTNHYKGTTRSISHKIVDRIPLFSIYDPNVARGSQMLYKEEKRESTIRKPGRIPEGCPRDPLEVFALFLVSKNNNVLDAIYVRFILI